MLFLAITLLIFAFFIFLIIVYKYVVNKNKKESIDVMAEAVESLNVEKIKTVENDKDFIRNEFWFQFKEKQTINVVNFYKLKRLFDEEHVENISDLLGNKDELDALEIENLVLIQHVISDDYSTEKIAKAFYLLEKRIK